ncbi:hypothetical protein [Jeotgalibacillus marinus]|uniref:LysM domain-containing protein n=1 Tax=Jeotgalibacillus marinus TaxID=86667 RepID=A0ABV3PZZ2_9BACL
MIKIKKLVCLFLIAFFSFIFYMDITQGTIDQVVPVQSQTITGVEAIARPGDSLLTMLKRHDLLPSSVNVDQLSNEFSALNQGIAPHKIITGERYLLPIPN